MSWKTRMALNEIIGISLIVTGAILSAESWFGVLMVVTGAILFTINTLEIGKEDKEDKHGPDQHHDPTQRPGRHL